MYSSTDGLMGVQQSPNPDRQVDNALVTNQAGQSVYRQRIDAPTLEDRLEMIIQLLEPVALAMGTVLDVTLANSALRTEVLTGTLGTLNTLSAVGTVNGTSVNMAYDQIYSGYEAEQVLISNIIGRS